MNKIISKAAQNKSTIRAINTNASVVVTSNTLSSNNFHSSNVNLGGRQTSDPFEKKLVDFLTKYTTTKDMDKVQKYHHKNRAIRVATHLNKEHEIGENEKLRMLKFTEEYGNFVEGVRDQFNNKSREDESFIEKKLREYREFVNRYENEHQVRTGTKHYTEEHDVGVVEPRTDDAQLNEYLTAGDAGKSMDYILSKVKQVGNDCGKEQFESVLGLYMKYRYDFWRMIPVKPSQYQEFFDRIGEWVLSQSHLTTTEQIRPILKCVSQDLRTLDLNVEHLRTLAVKHAKTTEEQVALDSNGFALNPDQAYINSHAIDKVFSMDGDSIVKE